jgi:hypothetical protein
MCLNLIILRTIDTECVIFSRFLKSSTEARIYVYVGKSLTIYFSFIRYPTKKTIYLTISDNDFIPLLDGL